MIAARQIYLGRGADGGGWQNPYVTDGLIAMWDGEWNVSGGGAHDPNATMWTDIAGGATIALSATDCTVGDKSVTTLAGHTLTSTIAALADEEYSSTNIITIETVSKISDYPTYTPYIQLGQRHFRTYADSGASIRSEYALPRRVTTSLSFTSSKFNPANAHAITLACSYLPSAGVGDTKLYINGNEATLQSRSNLTPTAVGINELVLGFPSSGVLELFCLRIYRGALSAATVVANYAIDKERFSLP